LKEILRLMDPFHLNHIPEPTSTAMPEAELKTSELLGLGRPFPFRIEVGAHRNGGYLGEAAHFVGRNAPTGDPRAAGRSGCIQSWMPSRPVVPRSGN